MTARTDKYASGFAELYADIAGILGPKARVLELGIDQGGSLELWRALFPGGTITGVDIKVSQCGPQPPRTRLIRADASDPGLLPLLCPPYDLIVDDASHVAAKTRSSLDLLWPLVTPGGYYVIEDWMIGLPGFSWHWAHDPGMLTLVKDLAERLDSLESEVEAVLLRYGIAVIRKRGNRS